MKIIQKTYSVYNFDELSKEVRSKIIAGFKEVKANKGLSTKSILITIKNSNYQFTEAGEIDG